MDSKLPALASFEAFGSLAHDKIIDASKRHPDGFLNKHDICKCMTMSG
jgi:hypothetical protein